MADRRSFKGLALALVLTALRIPGSFAQVSTTGTINGAVTDSSGAAVPQASIAISNEANGESRVVTSNTDGTFVAAALPSGIYTVTVSRQGFQTSKEAGIAVHPTGVVTVNPVLKIGEVSTSVEVQAMAAAVQTTSPEISGEITGVQAESLPMNGRNFQTLGSLMPGVTNTAVGTALGGGADQDGAYLSVNGMGGSGTLYLMDGMWNEDPAGPQVSITPPPESIEEMRLLQNNFSVQYNLMGANVFMLQTKSGGSTLHGSAWEFLRNDAMDARNFFSPTVPALRQNIFGFNLGGPVIIPGIYNGRNKTFFFVTEQWRYQDLASAILSASPTADMRNGLFSSPIKDPTTGVPFPQTSSGQYQIPASMISAPVAGILNVSGNSMEMTITGFIPGRTPTTVPSRAPMKQ